MVPTFFNRNFNLSMFYYPLLLLWLCIFSRFILPIYINHIISFKFIFFKYNYGFKKKFSMVLTPKQLTSCKVLSFLRKFSMVPSDCSLAFSMASACLCICCCNCIYNTPMTTYIITFQHNNDNLYYHIPTQQYNVSIQQWQYSTTTKCPNRAMSTLMQYLKIQY